jgi:hypothetical protein
LASGHHTAANFVSPISSLTTSCAFSRFRLCPGLAIDDDAEDKGVVSDFCLVGTHVVRVIDGGDRAAGYDLLEIGWQGALRCARGETDQAKDAAGDGHEGSIFHNPSSQSNHNSNSAW